MDVFWVRWKVTIKEEKAAKKGKIKKVTSSGRGNMEDHNTEISV